jgi:hypothetical protein
VALVSSLVVVVTSTSDECPKEAGEDDTCTEVWIEVEDEVETAEDSANGHNNECNKDGVSDESH